MGFGLRWWAKKHVSKYGFILSLDILWGLIIWFVTGMDQIWNTPIVTENVNYMNFPSQDQNANLSPWMKLEMPGKHLMVLPHCLKKPLKMHRQCLIRISDLWLVKLCSCRNAARWRHWYTTIHFEYLDNLIAGDIDKETFDDLHRCLVRDAQRQSERGFPRMSVCNEITYDTKMCGS